jgi:hypothetical protein
LVHEDGGESVAIFGEEFLKKGGAASGRGDDKYGLVNLLPAKAGIKDMIKNAPDEHDDPESADKKKEEGDDHPASELERSCEVVQIKSFGGNA